MTAPRFWTVPQSVLCAVNAPFFPAAGRARAWLIDDDCMEWPCPMRSDPDEH